VSTTAVRVAAAVSGLALAIGAGVGANTARWDGQHPTTGTSATARWDGVSPNTARWDGVSPNTARWDTTLAAGASSAALGVTVAGGVHKDTARWD
jgi:hypothetical protein